MKRRRVTSRHSATFDKRYQTKAGEWETTTTYFPRDLLTLAEVARQAAEWINSQPKEADSLHEDRMGMAALQQGCCRVWPTPPVNMHLARRLARCTLTVSRYRLVPHTITQHTIECSILACAALSPSNIATPQWLFDEWHAKYNYTLDPCSTHANAKTERHFTKMENGLT